MTQIVCDYGVVADDDVVVYGGVVANSNIGAHRAVGEM